MVFIKNGAVQDIFGTSVTDSQAKENFAFFIKLAEKELKPDALFTIAECWAKTQEHREDFPRGPVSEMPEDRNHALSAQNQRWGMGRYA